MRKHTQQTDGMAPTTEMQGTFMPECSRCILRGCPGQQTGTPRFRQCIAISPNGNAIHAFPNEFAQLAQPETNDEHDPWTTVPWKPLRPLPPIGEPRPELIDTIANIDVCYLGDWHAIGKLARASRRWRNLPMLATESLPYDRTLILNIVGAGAHAPLTALLGRAGFAAAAADDDGLWDMSRCGSWTLFHHACASGSTEMVEVLLKSPLMAGAGRGIDGGKSAIGEQGAALGRGQWPALTGMHAAARAGKVDVLRWLIAHGCNPRRSAFPYSGHGEVSALHLAALAGSADCCRLLIDSRCHVNAETGELRCFSNVRRGLTPLALACVSGNVATVALLLQHTTVTEAPSSEDDQHLKERGIMPLHQAARRNEFEVCSLLCAAGADPNAKAYICNTILNEGRKPWDGKTALRPIDLTSCPKTRAVLSLAAKNRHNTLEKLGALSPSKAIMSAIEPKLQSMRLVTSKSFERLHSRSMRGTPRVSPRPSLEVFT